MGSTQTEGMAMRSIASLTEEFAGMGLGKPRSTRTESTAKSTTTNLRTRVGGYINNDLYMPHCTGRHKPTTTSNDQMEISDGSTWPRKQVTARYAEGDARYFPSRGRGW